MITKPPIQVNIKDRLLGIIKSKKQVEMDYFEKLLKIPRLEIIGLIYELIGNNEIYGEFNGDDSQFKLGD